MERALVEVARSVAGAASPWQAASEASQALVRELGLQSCAISLYDETADLLRLVAGFGLSAADAARLAERPLQGDPCEPGLREGVWISDELGMAVAPLLAGGRRTGAVRLVGGGGSLDNSVRWLLEILGPLLGAALCKAPSLSSAEARLKDLGTLAASVAHDFNNLLTTILGNARLLESRADAAARRRLDAISRAGRDGAQLVARLLNHARRRSASVGPVSLAQVAREALELTRTRWKDGHGAPALRIETLLQEGPPILADAAGMRDAFVNLILNALDAMPEGGTLTVRTGTSGAWVLGEVKDTGAGIQADQLPRVFESFYTTKGERGTGLGLTAVARAAREAGGTVEVESMPGIGTQFRMLLPPAPRAARGAREVAAAPVSAERPLFGKRILVVEDDPDNRELLCEMLRLAGSTTHAVGTAAEAVVALEQSAFDVVLTDLGLPHTSGTAVVASARKLQRQQPVVIVLTGWAATIPDADVVLQKPVALEPLLAAIARALEARRTPKELVLDS